MLKQIQNFLERCSENKKGIIIFVGSVLLYIILNQAMNNYIQDREIRELSKPSIGDVYIEGIKNLKKNINDDLNVINANKAHISILEGNVDKNVDLLDCKIGQLERIVNDLEVTEDYCESQEIDTSMGALKKNDDKVIIEEIKVSENAKEGEIEVKTVKRVGFSDEKNKQIQYAYKKSGYNRDMILTFLSENDTWELNRPSDKMGFDGNRAFGICQLYRTYHNDFINSPEFQDPYKQIDYCVDEWNRAEDKGILDTTWYAYVFRFNAERVLEFKG